MPRLLCLLQVRHYTEGSPMFSDIQVLANSADPEEQSDQGLHCLPFNLHLLDRFLNRMTSFFEF